MHRLIEQGKQQKQSAQDKKKENLQLQNIDMQMAELSALAERMKCDVKFFLKLSDKGQKEVEVQNNEKGLSYIWDAEKFLERYSRITENIESIENQNKQDYAKFFHDPVVVMDL